MMGYNIEFYPYLPKILKYFFLYFDFRSDPEPDPDPDPHPWVKVRRICKIFLAKICEKSLGEIREEE